MFTLATGRGRKKLSDDAGMARRSGIAVMIAWMSVIIYNIVGVGDIISTSLAIELGRGQEANPIIRTAMEQTGSGWITFKLIMQGVISYMVLWFPHWIVLTMFTFATTMNALVVYNNFIIGGFI